MANFFKSIGFYLSIFQIVVIVLLGVFGEFSTNQSPTDLYQTLKDIKSMTLIGYGFSMTFLKKYGFGSIGSNFLTASVVLEWAILMKGWIQMIELKKSTFQIDISSLIQADYCAIGVLVSLGAVIGKVTLSQLLIMTVIEVVIQSFNEFICTKYIKAYDTGNSLYVHTFGAYFGLAVAKALHNKIIKSEKEGSSYNSDIFAMIGTLFLWLYWPSFNSATAVNDEAKTRAIVNTYLSLAGSCVTTFMISVIVGRGKLNMVHVQNATLAGGVAVGAVADVITRPVGSVIIGSFSGIVSTLGFQYLTPLLKKINIHDTCGVHNLHGVPGLISGVASGIVAAVANREMFGNTNEENNIDEQEQVALDKLNGFVGYKFSLIEFFEANLARTNIEQAGFQMLALVLTLGLSIVGGIFTGLIMRLPIFEKINYSEDMFEDELDWDIEEFIKLNQE